MINVLSLITFKAFPPQMGGQKGVALFYKYLKQYINLTIASSKNNSNDDFILKEILYPNKKIYMNAFSLSKLKKIIKEKSIDVIIVEHSYPAWIAYLLKIQTGIPFIIHSHNIEAYRFKQMKKWWWKWYMKYENRIHKKADFNFFISEEDQEFAINNFDLQKGKTYVIPYGIEPHPPTFKEKKEIKKSLSLPEDQSIFFFNGTLDYAPNIEAIEILLNDIEPLLKNNIPNFKIIICGKGIKENTMKRIIANKNFIYKGFVEDIDRYYTASDIFLNPVTNNSGVKTKVIEALANNCTVVSFASGAVGIPSQLCGKKMIVVNDNDFKMFVEEVVLNKHSIATTPQSFYDYFNWNNIALNAFNKIQVVVNK